MFRAHALVLLSLAACREPAPSAVHVPAPPPPASSVAPVPEPPVLRPPARVVALDGLGAIANAAWVEKGAVAVTRTELWRFRPEAPEDVHVVRLALGLGLYGVITATEQSALVAVPLADGRVDILDENGVKHTIPPAAKVSNVLGLRFSPDQSVLAVTRDGPTWKDETTFYELASGKALGKVDGPNTFFDPTGKLVAARGGLFAVDGGKLIARFKEGFWVQGDGDRMVSMDTTHGEVMAGDWAARGFFQGSAFFAGTKAIELIDVVTGKATSIPAPCPGGATRAGSVADVDHGRVIGTCNDAILVTDLATRTTMKIAVPVQKRRHISAPEVYAPKHTTDVLVREVGENGHIIDTQRGTARVATHDEFSRFAWDAGPESCVRRGGARVDERCTTPGVRADGHRLALRDGLTVYSPAVMPVIEWPSAPRASYKSPQQTWAFHQGAFERREQTSRALAFRFGGAPAPGELFPSSGCGKSPGAARGEPWFTQHITDTHAFYTGYRATVDRVTGHVACVCNASGCTTQTMVEEAHGAGDDGTVLSTAQNDARTATQVFLRHPKKPTVRGTVPASCIHGTITRSGRIFVSCDIEWRGVLFELSPKDLSIVARRPSAEGGSLILEAGEDLLVGHDTAVILPIDWVKDPSLVERGELIASESYAVFMPREGKAQIAGDEEAAAKILRCFDGEHLRPFATCR